VAFPAGLVGVWDGGDVGRIAFAADGRFEAARYRGTATVRGRTMVMRLDTGKSLTSAWSLDGGILLGMAFQRGDNPLLAGLGVRAGYNIPMNGNVSVWPKLGLTLAHSDGFFLFGDRTYLEVSVTAPFLVHVAPHFFIGGGPGLITQLGDVTVATLNVSAVVGGYF
jgi:hypothetical protein